MLDLIQVPPAQAVADWLAEHDDLVEVFCPPGQHDVQVRPDRICRAFIALISQSHRRLLI
jgi:hypothetical protein